MADKKKIRLIDKGIMPALILVLVCAICTGLLAFTNSVTAPIREGQRKNRLIHNRRDLFPAAQDFKSIDMRDNKSATNIEGLDGLFRAQDKQGTMLGYLAEMQVQGYGGTIYVMVGIDNTNTIKGVRILDNEETAGLGKKIELADFFEQFSARDPHQKFVLGVTREQGGIDAVSGATISSQAVVTAVNFACEAWKTVEEDK